MCFFGVKIKICLEKKLPVACRTDNFDKILTQIYVYIK